MLPDAQLAAAKKNLARQKFQEAETAIAKDQLDTAQTLLEQANIYDPDQPYILELLGRVLARNNKMIEAGAAFRKAIQLDPGYAGAHHNLAVFYVTQKPPWTELARWHYKKALAAGFPRNPDLEKMLDLKEPQDPAH